MLIKNIFSISSFSVYHIIHKIKILYLIRFFSLLDQLENHVERLRREAARLEEERDGLLATLDSLKNSESMSDLDECKY